MSWNSLVVVESDVFIALMSVKVGEQMDGICLEVEGAFMVGDEWRGIHGGR